MNLNSDLKPHLNLSPIQLGPNQLSILPVHNRRRGERRRTTIASLICGHRLARRRDARRLSNQNGYHVDWYEPHLLYLIVSVLLLSCADALLTLNLLELGGREINTFMAMLINIDVRLFAALKMGFTGAGLLFLVIYHRFRVFRRLRVDYLLRAVLLLYLMLIGYELMLLEPGRAPAPAKLIVAMAVTLAVMELYLDCKRSKIMARMRAK